MKHLPYLLVRSSLLSKWCGYFFRTYDLSLLNISAHTAYSLWPTQNRCNHDAKGNRNNRLWSGKELITNTNLHWKPPPRVCMARRTTFVVYYFLHKILVSSLRDDGVCSENGMPETACLLGERWNSRWSWASCWTAVWLPAQAVVCWRTTCEVWYDNSAITDPTTANDHPSMMWIQYLLL